MEPPQGPPDRLPVRNDQIELVQPIEMLRIVNACHDPVHSQCCCRVRTALLGSASDLLDSGFVVDRRDLDTEDGVFSEINHAIRASGQR